MSQKNIERQELSMTPLEIARNKSAENLKTYGLDFGRNGSGNLNYISAIKHSLRNEDPNVDYFDDYSTSFYEALKKFQEKKGLNTTGILDIETLVELDKAYPNTFKDSERAKFLKYFQNKNEYISKESKNISKETKEKIVNSELDLVGDNIGKPKNEVLETVRKSLNLTGNLEEMRKQIVNFQKMHCLNEADGIIGKETYYEVVAKDYFTNDKQSEILEKGPSKADQKIILEIFENGRISSVELNKISIILKNFKEKNSTNANFESEFGDFYKKYDALVTEYRNSPAGKADEQMADKNRESLYGAMKKMVNGEMEITEGIKQIATNPALVLTAGITFLFGMWGSETKMSDAWWKRILLLIAAPVAVPAAWKLAGGNEILDDIGNGVKDVKNGLNSSEAQAQKNEIASETHNFIVKEGTETATWVKDRTNEIYNGVKTGDTSKLPAFLGGAAIADKNLSKEQIENRIYKDTNEVFNSMFNKNLSYSKSGNESEKSKFIEKEDFTTISNALHKDSKFSNELIEDINSIKSDSAKLKEKLDTDTKNKLFGSLTGDKLKKREQDLVTFVDLLLKEKEGKDVYISDIFIKEKGFFERAKESLIENEITTYMKDEPKLNAEISTILVSLSLNIKSEVSSILSTINLGDANNEEKINKLTKYINENSVKIGEDKEKLELLRNIYIMELEYKKFEARVDAIDVNGGKESFTKLNEEKVNIDKKYNEIKLSKPKNDSNKIFGDKIKEKISQKEKEIYDATADKSKLGDEVNKKMEKEKYDKNIDEIFEKIGSDKPAHNLTSYREYFSNKERVLAYNKLFDAEYLCKNTSPELLQCNWNGGKPTLPEVFGKINKPNLTEDEKRYNKIGELINQYEEIVKNIKKLAEEEVKNIKALKSEIEKTKTNTELYKLKQEEFGKKLSEIVNRVYPNEKPESFTDISAYIDYMSKNNRTSVYTEIISNLKAINGNEYYTIYFNETDGTKVSDFDKYVMNELSLVKNVLPNATTEVGNNIKNERKADKVGESVEISTAYNNFYNNAIETLNSHEKQLNDYKSKKANEPLKANEKRLNVDELIGDIKELKIILPSSEKLSLISIEELIVTINSFSSGVAIYNKNITEGKYTEPIFIEAKNFSGETKKVQDEMKAYINKK